MFQKAGVFALAALVFSPLARGEIAILNQTVSVVLQPQGKVSVPAGLALLKGAQAFSAYGGTLTLSYRFRTAPGTASTVTVRAGAEFSPAGGPSVAAGALTFTCGAAGYGSACSGTQTVSTAAQRTVVTLPSAACTGGGGGCSAADPATVGVSFVLDNSPVHPTGTYSVPLVFTVSGL